MPDLIFKREFYGSVLEQNQLTRIEKHGTCQSIRQNLPAKVSSYHIIYSRDGHFYHATMEQLINYWNFQHNNVTFFYIVIWSQPIIITAFVLA